jgi:glycosyltransferase involved in cell wall biosynthesis
MRDSSPRIATEHISDPYGGLYYRLEKIKKYSTGNICEVPPWLTRKFINRSRWARAKYRSFMLERGLRGFDIIHSRTHPWFIELCRRSRNDKCRWVHTYHAIFHEEDYAGGLKPWQKELNRAGLEVGSEADARISVSKWGHDMLLEKYGIETVVIENGVDLEICDRADGKRFSERTGKSDFILFVGSYREVKNPLLFLELARRMPERDLIMAGDGLDEKTLTGLYGISVPDNVSLMGRMPHDDVLDAMSACRVYVMTSRHEGLPNTLLEAMALSRPVVVPSHTGCLELVPDERFGFLYDLSDTEVFFRKVEEALEDKERGRKARERVEERYNWRTLVGRLDGLYGSLFRED